MNNPPEIKEQPENLENKQNLETATFDAQMNDRLFQFVDLNETVRSTSLVGKPKNAFLDILKRFCKNYVALFSVVMVGSIA